MISKETQEKVTFYLNEKKENIEKVLRPKEKKTLEELKEDIKQEISKTFKKKVKVKLQDQDMEPFEIKIKNPINFKNKIKLNFGQNLSFLVKYVILPCH